MRALIVQFGARIHDQRCRDLSSSTSPPRSEVTANVVSLHSPIREDGQGRSITGGPAETRSGSERLSQSRASPPRRNVPFSRSILALSGGPSHRIAAARTGRVWVLLERNPPNRPLVPAGTPTLRRESNPAPQIKKEHHARQDRSTRLATQVRRHRPNTPG